MAVYHLQAELRLMVGGVHALVEKLVARNALSYKGGQST